MSTTSDATNATAGTTPTDDRSRLDRLRARLGSSEVLAWAYLVPLVAYLAVFYAYPMFRNVELSVREYTARTFVQGGAPFVGLDNFVDVVQSATFAPAMWNTIVFTVVSIAVQFSIGLALAVFFQRNFPLSSPLRALFLVPWLLPLIVSSSTWAWMLNSESGIINAFLGLFGVAQVNWLTSPDWALTSVIIANIWIGIPFNLVILYSGLQSISEEVFEAAAVDGATGWQRFRHVTFPLLKPVTTVTLLLGLVYTLKVFDIIWIMTRGGPGSSSTTLAIWSYELGFGSLVPRLGPGAAVGNILILVALAVGLLYVEMQRREAREQ